MTPYKASKVVNARLDKEGIKRIPSQMMYNYTTQRINHGKKPLIDFTPEKGVDEKSLLEWLEKYVNNKKSIVVEVVEEVDIDQLEFDFEEK